MYRTRKGRVDPARQWVGAQGIPAPQPPVDLAATDAALQAKQQAVADIAQQDIWQGQAAYDQLVSRGYITAIERVGRTQSLAAVTPPVTVVTYTVPANYVFRFTRLSFAFTDPIIHQLNLQTYLPWNVLINENPIPGLGEQNSLPYAVGPGSIYMPMEFDPIWLQGGDVLSVQVRTLAAVTIELNAIARIGGWLHDRSGLKLGVGV